MREEKGKSEKMKHSKNQPKKLFSWLTDDAHELALRKERALKEPMTLKRTGQRHKIFSDFDVSRTGISGAPAYKVEIRSLDKNLNYCNCLDFHKNFLGTCKHIERALASLSIPQGKCAESPFVEIFIDHSDGDTAKIMIPRNLPQKTMIFLKTYLNEAGSFKISEYDTLSVLVRDIENAGDDIKASIRISGSVAKWLDKTRRKAEMDEIKRLFRDKFRSSHGCANFLKHPLYDYQIEGMLHLAFSGRAMLADEMGLGKTVQAIAAAHVMHDLFKVRRVLLVTPVSLKTEWEEQIRKFTDLSFHTVYGGRKERLHAYSKSDAFFLICNYEQVIRDISDINSLCQPDLVILDEAQRIKNWRTKSAQTIKKLDSKFAFILTGTPIENRIDELYSITEFIDPTIFGSLFRFNRNFYSFDVDGKVSGLKRLRELHETIKQVMLRRRKDEVEDQLPERVDNNYFVKMTGEQQLRYDDHQDVVVRILAIAKHRPLTDEEFKNLQMRLACMRMLCDSVYILDSEISESPKIEELVNVLNDIWADSPERKVIVFSEWVRMLELAKNQFESNNIGFAWHTGSVAQIKRRGEINRFKNDPGCKVFLSSDSGGLGLNLQAASVVVNLDLPWNPAKLEQRIARAWRKHQKNSVNVINFISENTIEHRMLATLAFKSGIAEGVLDGRGDIAELEKPNAKAGFLKRLFEIMQTPPPSVQTEEKSAVSAHKTDLVEKIRQNIAVKASDSLRSFKVLRDESSGAVKAMLAVSFEDSETAAKLIDSALSVGEKDPELDGIKEKVAVIDIRTSEILQKLASMGIIAINDEAMKEILAVGDHLDHSEKLKAKRRELRRNLHARSEKNAARLLKMAEVLLQGSFAEEARKPASESLISAAKCLMISSSEEIGEEPPENIGAENLKGLKERFPQLLPDFSNLALALSAQENFLSAEELILSSKRILTESENAMAQSLLEK